MSGDDWATPQWLFDKVVELYGHFDLDVCASEENSKCKAYWDKESDSLKMIWCKRNWCNPPYSNITPWVKRASEEAKKGNYTVMLLPADFSTKWFKLCWENSVQIDIINHRIKFVGATSSPKFASMLVHFSAKNYEGEDPIITLKDFRDKKG